VSLIDPQLSTMLNVRSPDTKIETASASSSSVATTPVSTFDELEALTNKIRRGESWLTRNVDGIAAEIQGLNLRTVDDAKAILNKWLPGFAWISIDVPAGVCSFDAAIRGHWGQRKFNGNRVLMAQAAQRTMATTDYSALENYGEFKKIVDAVAAHDSLHHFSNDVHWMDIGAPIWAKVFDVTVWVLADNMIRVTTPTFMREYVWASLHGDNVARAIAVLKAIDPNEHIMVYFDKIGNSKRFGHYHALLAKEQSEEEVRSTYHASQEKASPITQETPKSLKDVDKNAISFPTTPTKGTESKEQEVQPTKPMV
jgi:hypothetical protein